MAEIKSRIEENRERLQDKIPIDTPYLMLIEPTDKCNFRCKFCPTSDLKLMKATEGRNYGNMNFNLYKKVIDDTSEFKNNIKKLRLYNSGEPLLNPMFPNMVEYAKKSGKFDRIETISNGYLLNEQLSKKIIESGLDGIFISIEGLNAEQYYNIANVKIDFNKLVDNIEFFFKNKRQCQVYVKIVGNNLSEQDKQEFYNIFGNICDSLFIEYAAPLWNNFGIKSEININENQNLFENNIVFKKVCPLIFYTMAVNSNGTVSPCCSDWSRKVIIGDANHEKLKSIWNGEKLRNLQKMHLSGGRKNHVACSTCGLPEYGSQDNIDDYADDILFKMNTTL